MIDEQIRLAARAYQDDPTQDNYNHYRWLLTLTGQKTAGVLRIGVMEFDLPAGVSSAQELVEYLNAEPLFRQSGMIPYVWNGALAFSSGSRKLAAVLGSTEPDATQAFWWPEKKDLTPRGR